MTTVVTEISQERADECGLAEPRTDLLIEREREPGVFVQETGPFERYRRRVVEITDDGTPAVREEIDFRLAIPIWRPLFTPLMKRALRDTDRTPRRRWWWPRQVLTERSATLIAVIGVLSVVAGYLGVVISQTLTFAAAEFGADDAAQGRTLAAIRIGVLASLLLIGRADRIGRRPMLIGFALASILFTMAGALADGLLVLGITQALARGFDTGLLTLLTLAVTEEVPAGVRATSLGLMAMCTGLGAGMVVWVLPVADLSVGAWRTVYVAPVLFLPLLYWVWRVLPETRRFDAAVERHPPGTIDRGRFTLLAVSAFAAAMFLSPASQLQNEYLREERGFSAAGISLFRILISTPVGIVILGAGYLADRSGRRLVGAVGLGLGAVMTTAAYFSEGVGLWLTSLAGVWLLGAAFPALRGYQTELFPTRARAKVGGWIDVIAVTGSAVGLLIVGQLSTTWGRLGPAVAVMLWGPLLVSVLVLTRYPETASQELEVFNPRDPELDRP